MSKWIQGIDLSVYQGDIPQATWDALADAGQEVAVVGSWHGLSANPYAERNLERADRTGMAIATYVALNSGNGAAAVHSGLDACGAMEPKLRFVALDCEIDGITDDIIESALALVENQGHRPVIYTARWWWQGHYGDRTTFSYLPLWNAYYDADPDIDFPHASYGDWGLGQLMGEQFTGSTELVGVTVDRNTFRQEFIEGDDMPNKEALAKVATLYATAQAYALLGLPMPADVKAQLRWLLNS